MAEQFPFTHCCPTPSSERLRKRPWTCPYCRRTWTPEGVGAWHTNDQGGEVVGLTMRYPDGSTQTFGHVEEPAPSGAPWERVRLRRPSRRSSVAADLIRSGRVPGEVCPSCGFDGRQANVYRRDELWSTCHDPWHDARGSNG